MRVSINSTMIFKSIEKIIVRINITLTALSLAAMVIIGLAQVILRNLFDSGLSWGDVVFRMLALWVGFSGGVVAASRGRHIAIGAFIKFVPERFRRIAHIAASIFTSAVCFFLAYSSTRFVLSERSAGGTLIGSIPLWISELIIPAAFCCLTYQFLIHTFEPPPEGIE